MAERRQEPPGWRFERRVTLGDILGVLSMLVLGLLAYADLRERQAVTETTVTNYRTEQVRTDARQDAALLTLQTDIRAELAAIRQSIEHLAAREHAPR